MTGFPPKRFLTSRIPQPPRRLRVLRCGTFHYGKDIHNKMIVSVRDQKMLLVNDGNPVKSYKISTSKFGVGDRPGSNCTPLGRMQVAKKIGDNAPLGSVFKSRRPTGEVIKPNAPGRDPDRHPHPLAQRHRIPQQERLPPDHLHPWHARGTPPRRSRLLWLHPHGQPRRRGPLRPHRLRCRRFRDPRLHPIRSRTNQASASINNRPGRARRLRNPRNTSLTRRG